MKKKIYVFTAVLAVVFGLAGIAFAHTLYMTVADNEDGTVTVSGMYSTGAVAGATEVRLEDRDQKVLLKGKTDADGEFTFEKPETDYTIIMDAGPGHMVREAGP